MKHTKKFAAIAAAALVAVSLLAGCGGAVEPAPTESGMSMGVVNPLQAFTLEELRNETGYNLHLPEGCTDLTVTKIDAAPAAAVYEAEFCDKDGNGYCFRMQLGQVEGDISGMYYEWTDAIIVDEVDSSYTVFLNNEGQGMVSWQDENAKYTLAMTENAAAKLLNTMRSALLEKSGFTE